MNVDYAQAHAIDSIRELADNNQLVQVLMSDYYQGCKSAKNVIDVIAALCHMDLIARTANAQRNGNGFE